MSVNLVVDVGLYPVEVVMSTAYVFIDRCYVLLDKATDGGVKVSLSPKPGTSEEALQGLLGEFQNELLGQALRQRIAERHEKVRETIVARALFGAAPRVTDGTEDVSAESEAEVDVGTGGPPQELPSEEQLGLDAKFLPQDEDDYLEDPLGIAVPWEEKYGNASGAAGEPAVTDATTANPRDGGKSS